MSSWQPAPQSAASARTMNPIRGIVDAIAPNPHHPKSFLKLSIGDPTLDGNLLPPPQAVAAIKAAVESHKFDGYAPSIGYPATLSAIADFWSTNFAPARPKPFAGADVIATSGASHALELAVGAMCDAGDALLVPAPGFSLYGVLCSNKGIHQIRYDCLPDRAWEIDLAAMEKTIVASVAEGKTKIRGLIINNPSNPAGSNFSRQHVSDICDLAAKYRLPIIADEIYAGMAFGGATFTSVACFANVPALIIGGVAKCFVVPGWRVGWMIKHDAVGALDAVWKGCVSLSQMIIGPNTLVQAAVPAMLAADTNAYRQQLTQTIEAQSALCYDLLSTAPGLRPIRATGAMYMLVRVDFDAFDAAHAIKDDVAFATQLMAVENVQVLPGAIFGAPGFVRIVVTKPPEQLKEAVERIVAFVAMLSKKA